MIQTKNIKTLGEFKRLKKGDTVACEFKRDVHCRDAKVRFGTFKIHSVNPDCNEIILQKKHNVYFNYAMFLNPTESSNLKSIILITSID